MAEQLSKNFETLQLHAGKYSQSFQNKMADKKLSRPYPRQRNQLSSCPYLCNHCEPLP
jgi:hypothetical protein